MTGTLTQFQDAFADALFGAVPRDARVAGLLGQAGFAVYRNTVFKGCIDALQANFPAVVRLVGEEWFRATAAVYVQTSPPVDARLLNYGVDFAGFLADFEPARELTYLADVARLDRLWVEAHVAPEDTLVEVEAIATLPAERLEQSVLRPHAAARWAWFDADPAYTIWRANREESEVPGGLVWQGEGALLSRPRGEVIWRPLSAAGYAFLEASAAQLTFEAAAQRALDAQPDADLGAIVGALLGAGAFGQIHGDARHAPGPR